MTLLKIFFTASLILFTSLLFSQQESNSAGVKRTSKVYFYTFSGVLNADNIEQITDEIKKMRFVTEVKIEYKTEKAIGQVKLLATEFFTSTDTDFEFSIYDLKMLLVRNNLMPNDCRSEVVANN